MTNYSFKRALKPPNGSVIKRILMRCPSTGKLIETGRTVKEAAWESTKLDRPRLTCPHCRQVHKWTKKDVVLAR
jgi:hypothetical protein